MFMSSTMEDRRRHTASDMALYWDSFLSSGLFYDKEGNIPLEVSTDGDNNEVYIAQGRAVIGGHLYINTSELQKELELAPTSSDRIDRVVLRLDLSIENRFIKVFVKKGTENDPPELTREGDIYELSLAQIHLKAGKSFIEKSDIKDERLNSDLCGIASDGYTSARARAIDVFMQNEGNLYVNGNVEDSLRELRQPLSVFKSNVDDDGIFQVVEWKKGNTLYKKSVLSNKNSLGNYLKRTVSYYKQDGITPNRIEEYTINYNSDDSIVSEVLL